MTVIAPEVVAFLAAAARSPQLDGDVAAFRAALARHHANAGPARSLASVVDVGLGAVDVRVHRPDDRAGHPVLVYLHGGAFVRGDLQTSDVQAREVAARAPAVVVTVDYRLAPEHPHPAAIEDTRAALDWVLASIAEHGGDPRRVVLGGESAGANIALVVARERANDLAGVVLVSGVYDLADDLARARAELGDVLDVDADRRRLAWIGRLYAGDRRLDDPAVSPSRGPLEGIPPTLVVVSSLDPFAPQGRALERAIAATGTPTRLVDVDGMPHGFGNLAGLFPEAAAEAYAAIAAAVRDGIADAG